MASLSNSPIKVLITSDAGRKVMLLVPRGDGDCDYVTISDVCKAIVANGTLTSTFDVLKLELEIFDRGAEQFLPVEVHTPIKNLDMVRVPSRRKPSKIVIGVTIAIVAVAIYFAFTARLPGLEP